MSYQQANAPFQAALDMQQRAYDQEADLYDKQAQLALDEAGREALIKARDAESFRSQQALNYSASGVLLDGSPMMVLNETRRLAMEEVDAITARGGAQADLFRRKAGMTRTAGRASILGEQSKLSQQAAQARIQEINSRGPGKMSLAGSALASLGGSLISKGITGGTNPFAGLLGKLKGKGSVPPANIYGTIHRPLDLNPEDAGVGDYGLRGLMRGMT